MLYDWMRAIKSIERNVLVSVGISDVCYKAIELRVDFADFAGKKYGCLEVINIEVGNDLFNRDLSQSLNRIKLFMESKCLFNKK